MRTEMRAYVINLPRSSERRVHMLSQLADKGIEYSFVTAIDDREMDLHRSEMVHPSYLQRSEWCPGRVGNALSHLRAFEEILAEGIDQALVLEDDVTLSPEIGIVLDALRGHMVGAEVALIHFDSHDICELSNEGAVRLAGDRVLALPIDISAVNSAAGYVITREACERMTKTVLPVRSNADDWSHWYSEGAIDRVRCVFPHAVNKDPRFESTIEYRAPTRLKGRVLEAIRRYRIPLVGRLVSYRRKTIWSKLRIEFVDTPFVRRPSRLD
jgi:glycosyl transferase family 25